MDENVRRTRIPGGPIVLSERMEGVRSVAVGVWFRQGAVNEPAERRGISHLLEHMAFKGTERRSAWQLALAVERVGGTMDAYTGHEFTSYQARVPESRLGVALDVLGDMCFHPLLRDEDLEVERRVILEELAGIEDSPEDLAFELHAERLYGRHPYGSRVAGTPETVSGITVEELRALHARAYRSANAVVAAAGSVDHDELVDAIAAAFPPDAAPPAGPAPKPDPPEAGELRLERRGGRQSHLVAGAITVPHTDPLRYALLVTDTAFGAGMSSRLFQRIREERGLAYSVHSFAGFYTACGHAGAYLCTLPEEAGEAREALREEFRRLAEEGLEDEELAAARSQLRGQVLLCLESPPARMSRLAAIELHGEPYRSLDEVAERIDRVGPEDVAAAASLLHPDRLVVLELTPA